MAGIIHLEIVTPERHVVAADTDEVKAPGADGLFGVRKDHAPFVALISPGELSFRTDGQLHRYAIGGGFVQVADNKVTVIADTAEAAEEIDLERARRASEDARALLESLSDTDPRFLEQQARVRRAAVRIGVASGR
jgi:F-type H+-transporting ATPase subunit epsilon